MRSINYNDYKYIGRHKEYKYVAIIRNCRERRNYYQGAIKRGGFRLSKKVFDTPKEAALAVDRFLIKRGFEPVNILRRK